MGDRRISTPAAPLYAISGLTSNWRMAKMDSSVKVDMFPTLVQEREVQMPKKTKKKTSKIIQPKSKHPLGDRLSREFMEEMAKLGVPATSAEQNKKSHAGETIVVFTPVPRKEKETK